LLLAGPPCACLLISDLRPRPSPAPTASGRGAWTIYAPLVDLGRHPGPGSISRDPVRCLLAGRLVESWRIQISSPPFLQHAPSRPGMTPANRMPRYFVWADPGDRGSLLPAGAAVLSRRHHHAAHRRIFPGTTFFSAEWRPASRCCVQHLFSGFFRAPRSLHPDLPGFLACQPIFGSRTAPKKPGFGLSRLMPMRMVANPRQRLCGCGRTLYTLAWSSARRPMLSPRPHGDRGGPTGYHLPRGAPPLWGRLDRAQTPDAWGSASSSFHAWRRPPAWCGETRRRPRARRIPNYVGSRHLPLRAVAQVPRVSRIFRRAGTNCFFPKWRATMYTRPIARLTAGMTFHRPQFGVLPRTLPRPPRAATPPPYRPTIPKLAGGTGWPRLGADRSRARRGGLHHASRWRSSKRKARTNPLGSRRHHKAGMDAAVRRPPVSHQFRKCCRGCSENLSSPRMGGPSKPPTFRF